MSAAAAAACLLDAHLRDGADGRYYLANARRLAVSVRLHFDDRKRERPMDPAMKLTLEYQYGTTSPVPNRVTVL
eukprot:986871-Prymnesium_polylepis.2